jgi:hypothetical protein
MVTSHTPYVDPSTLFSPMAVALLLPHFRRVAAGEGIRTKEAPMLFNYPLWTDST